MDEPQPVTQVTLQQATEQMAQWFSDMKRKFHLQETTLMDLFRLQLMWAEQNARQPVPSGQELIDAIAAEVREADETITAEPATDD